MPSLKPLLACAIALLVSLPLFGQNRSSDRWVASWATALVARPQGQGGPGRGQGPAAPQPAAAQPAPSPATGGSAPAAPTVAPSSPTASPAAPGGGRGGFPGDAGYKAMGEAVDLKWFE